MLYPCAQTQPKAFEPQPKEVVGALLEAEVHVLSELCCQSLCLFLLDLLGYGYFQAAADRN